MYCFSKKINKSFKYKSAFIFPTTEKSLELNLTFKILEYAPAIFNKSDKSISLKISNICGQDSG